MCTTPTAGGPHWPRYALSSVHNVKVARGSRPGQVPEAKLRTFGCGHVAPAKGRPRSTTRWETLDPKFKARNTPDLVWPPAEPPNHKHCKQTHWYSMRFLKWHPHKNRGGWVRPSDVKLQRSVFDSAHNFQLQAPIQVPPAQLRNHKQCSPIYSTSRR